jgi:cob(I)alamin adenosyltransferase
MLKLYTKTGDDGQTSLYDLRRVDKDEHIFEVLGDIDELSSYIGMLCSQNLGNHENFLRKIQSKLLDLGSDVATVKNRKYVNPINEDDVKELENLIDLYDSQNEKLTEFILPGVNIKDSICHLCRSICRKTERHLWKLKKEKIEFKTEISSFHYINRLSDLFFAFARFISDGKEVTRTKAKEQFC